MPRTVVVLVEDDPVVRLLAIDAIERAGFEVADFARADEVETYVESMPDAVAALLADVNVPGQRDGIELAHAFARRWPDKQIVLTSGAFGVCQPDDLPIGAEFIAKPWTSKGLMTRMAAILEARLRASEQGQAAAGS